MREDDELKLVFTNDRAKFYTNRVSQCMTDYCVSDLPNGSVKLYGHQVFLAERNSGAKSWVLANTEGEIIYDEQSVERMGAHIDMLRLAKTMGD